MYNLFQRLQLLLLGRHAFGTFQNLSSHSSSEASVAYIWKHLCNVPVSVFETTLFHRFLSSKYFGLHHKNPTQFYESIIKLSLWKKQHMRSHDSCFTDITQDPWLTSGSLRFYLSFIYKFYAFLFFFCIFTRNKSKWVWPNFFYWCVASIFIFLGCFTF